MFFSTFEELTLMDNTAIESEIIKVKGELVQLRLQKSTKQSFKPHMFKTLKRKVAQLLTIETQRKLKI
jgi:large subunit ribosomal protein L29